MKLHHNYLLRSKVLDRNSGDFSCIELYPLSIGIQSGLRDQQISRLTAEIRSKIQSQLIPTVLRDFENANPEMWQEIQYALGQNLLGPHFQLFV